MDPTPQRVAIEAVFVSAFVVEGEMELPTGGPRAGGRVVLLVVLDVVVAVFVGWAPPRE